MFTRLLAAVLLAAFAPFAGASPKGATFYISVDRGGGVGSAGTGTVIASEDGHSLLLTAAHVVKGAQSVSLVQLDSAGKPWSYKATVVAATGDGGIYPDLALIETPYELPAVEIAESLPSPGEVVTAWGYGPSHAANTWQPFLRVGRVASGANYVDPWIASSLPIIPGDSGCGAFNSAGQLVGCLSLGGGAALGANATSVTSFTRVSVKHQRFPRLHARLHRAKPAAPAAPKVPAAPAAPVTPPAAPSFQAGGCPGGKCPAPQSRRGFIFRR